MKRPLWNRYKRGLVATTVAILAMQLTTLEAGAACTAGNPNSTLPESTPSSAFINHGNGTVTHNLTGLMWKQCTQGLSGAGCLTGTATSMNWSAALASAVLDTTAGYGDWRLPNQKELLSIVESCGAGAAINQTMFSVPNSTPNYWSASSQVPVPQQAWFVYFLDGSASTRAKSYSQNFYARLVRGGKSLGSFDARGDYVPTPFSFVPQTGVPRMAVTSSNTITVGGVNVASPISIVGGSYAINGGAYTTEPGGAINGDAVVVQQTSSADYATATTATLTIGGLNAGFSVTTQAEVLNIFDVDGNGQVDALTDGLILIRYMFGLRGASLTAGSIGAGATRTGPEIEAYIQSVMPPVAP